MISIIMAAFNSGRTIDTAIRSVLAQTYQDWELLIADDCSGDNTLEIARGYADRDSRVRIIASQVNGGIAANRKRALDAAQGQWIAILDADDAWAADKLTKQMALQQETGAQLIFTGSGFLNAEGQQIEWTLHVPTRITYRQLLCQNLISNSSVLVSRELYTRHYVMVKHVHEDYAQWLMTLRTGIVAYGIDEPLLLYRLTDSSRSANKVHSAKLNWDTYRLVGLNVVEAVYYQVRYAIRGFLKYRNLK